MVVMVGDLVTRKQTSQESSHSLPYISHASDLRSSLATTLSGSDASSLLVMFQRYTSGVCKKGTKDKIGRVSSCLLLSLFCYYAGLPEGVYKGVRILMCVCIRIRTHYGIHALLSSLYPRAKHDIHVFTAARLHYTLYSHHTDRSSRFIHEPSLSGSFASPPCSFTSNPFASSPFGQSGLLLDLDPPFPIPFHPSTDPLTIAHVFNNSINE
jgi:hypothetical protein